MKYITGKRNNIIAFLKSNSEHAFSLESIAAAITPTGTGRSTVYRIVADLVSDGIIRKFSDEKSRHCVYQYIGNEECHSHLHLKCKKCGKLIHLDKSASQRFCDEILCSDGFKLDSSSTLFGTCEICAKTDKDKRCECAGGTSV